MLQSDPEPGLVLFSLLLPESRPPLPSLSRLVTLISACKVGKHLREMRRCDKCARKGMRGGSRPPWAPALPPTAGALLLSLLLQCFTTISSSVPLPLSWQSAHSWAAPGLGPGFPSWPICSVCGGWWMGWSRGHTEENLTHTTSWLYRLLSPLTQSLAC